MKRKNTLFALFASLALALSILPAHIAHAAAPAPRQGTYYLALGDSLSEGYQPDKAIAYTHGWVYQFRSILAKQAPIELINLALGAECTGTLVTGGLSPSCPVKTDTSPSQLAEAVAYLKAYTGKVNPITVEIGGDNLYSNMSTFLKATPAQQQQIVQTIFAPMGREWATIFSTLRKACPTCTIIAVNQYNPFPSSAAEAKSVAAVMDAYDTLLKQVAKPFGVKVADVCTAFVGHELAYTWIAQNDIHATTIGYTAMAQVVAKTSGMVR